MPRKKGTSPKMKVSNAQFAELAAAGAAPGLSDTNAAFHALMCKCLRVPVAPLDAKSAEFLATFDKGMRDFSKARGLAIRGEP